MHSFNVKRRWARINAKANGVECARTFVAVAPDTSSLRQHWKHVKELIRTPLVTLKTAADDGVLEHIVLETEAVAPTLSGIQASNSCEFYVAEYFEPRVCGLVGRLQGGGHLIECVPGDIQALYSGDTVFSTYYLDAVGRVTGLELRGESRIYQLDRNTGKAQLRETPPTVPTLRADEIASIVRMCEIAGRQFGEARVEWLCSMGLTVMYDLSIEEGTLVADTGEGARLLSRGTAAGNAIWVSEQDIEELRAAIKVNRSVVASDEETASLNAPKVASIREKILARGTGPVVIVSRFPDLALSVFIEDASGFVFTAGAVLSHLGIIIREARIPALISESASEIRDGDDILIADGNLRLAR